MAEMLQDTIQSRQAWTGMNLRGGDEYIADLSQETRDELAAAVTAAREKGLTVPDFGKPEWGADEFPVPSFAPMAERILDELENGLGFVRIRGVDTGRYQDAEDLAILFWGLQSHLGASVPQSVKQDYLGHVRNEGGEIVEGHYRGFKSAGVSPFHTDNCDVASLLCVRGAKHGGESSVVSSAQIHNDLLENDPESLAVLYAPFHGDWRGEEPEGWKPYFRCPIFSYHDGRLSMWGGMVQIKSAQEKYESVPRLSQAQIHALDAVERAADKNRFDFSLDAGEIFIFNNYAVLHSRTAYEDFAEPDRRRHLMRVWLAVPNGRPLAEDFIERYGPAQQGVPRGGYGASKAAAT